MRILLVEPDYRRRAKSLINKSKDDLFKIPDDESLWYPPLGLMKLARYHNNRGDQVKFSYGFNGQHLLFDILNGWDRVYITTLFTYDWDKIIKTIEYYKDVVLGENQKIYVGGIMASLFPERLIEETKVNVVFGTLDSARKIDIDDDTNIDELEPDYGLLSNKLYAINDTFYEYTTRGCRNKCAWCGVPKIEKEFIPYINIKDKIIKLRREFGDKPRLKLMDNNVLVSDQLSEIVEDLVNLGYGKNMFSEEVRPRQRVIDFNQGLDASFINEDTIKIISRLNIKPMRIAFDRIGEKDEYIAALKLAKQNGIDTFSNYMLYNFIDTPEDLYERLLVNIKLNERWRSLKRSKASIYSYPMRYAPIDSTISPTMISQDQGKGIPTLCSNEFEYKGTYWTKRFVRNIEIMKGAAHGCISPTPSLARRTIGETYNQFVENLYMPEELLRNRNKYEEKVYEHEPLREPGNGEIERFRAFIRNLLNEKDDRFFEFHAAVSKNSKPTIKIYLNECKDSEVKYWLKYYLM